MPRRDSQPGVRERLRGLWEFYLAYTNTGVHTAAAAALAIFGLLVFVDPLFAVVAIASYVLPPLVLYARSNGRRSVEPIGDSVKRAPNRPDASRRRENATADPPRTGAATAGDEPDRNPNRSVDAGDGDEADTDTDGDTDDGDADTDNGDTDTDTDADGGDTDTDTDADGGDTDTDTDRA
ncbi:hypothetical protein OB905_04595 [Halobacteria archaeon AArc-dxtr1]|nr:hypothetical protein [Halobacteria archaeon AArc-dxtr1]